MDTPHPWPLWNLVLRTPRLELRPADDAGALEMVALAREGIHPPEQMPFAFAWTDAPPKDMERNTLQHSWKLRAELTPESWTVQFLVRHEGEVIGTQDLVAEKFAVTKEINSGSWLGRRYQGLGFGTEMRAAMLLFAFDHLGAAQARSSVFKDNTASRRVSEKLGYVPDGTQRHTPRGRVVDAERLLLRAEDFIRPEWTLRAEGVTECLPLLIG